MAGNSPTGRLPAPPQFFIGEWPYMIRHRGKSWASAFLHPEVRRQLAVADYKAIEERIMSVWVEEARDIDPLAWDRLLRRPPRSDMHAAIMWAKRTGLI